SPTTSGQVKDTANTFIVSGDGALTGGSVQLPLVSINTSSTATNAFGGRVMIGAYAGPTTPGVITIGGINTSSTKGNGGSVTIIGEGGVQINGSIATNSTGTGTQANAGAVSVVAARPKSN